MTNDEFRLHAHQLADWMADYLENQDQYPVKPDVKPGEIKNQLPVAAPVDGEKFNGIPEIVKSSSGNTQRGSIN